VLPAWVVYVLLGALTAGLFAIRMTGPPNWLDNEYRLGAAVLDVLRAGNWICPRDALGHTDKPPLLTWFAALASLPAGRVTRVGLYLPSALATLGTACLVWAAGRRWFHTRAAVLAALALLLSDAAARQVATARFDALFSATVALAALAAFRAWNDGGSWTPFWLAAAASTLTKGPLGVLLAAGGLLAVPWERRSGRARPLAGSHAFGLLAWAALVFGWLGAALHVAGRRVVDDMLVGELVGHAVEHAPFRRVWVPPGDWLAMAAPWSVVACVAFVRLVVAPDPADVPRRFERFLFCWFFAGLLLFSAAPHTAARLLYPLLPPGALLAGRELARWSARMGARRLAAGAAAAVLAAGVALTLRYHRHERRDDEVRRSAAIAAVARRVRDAVGDRFPLTYVADEAGPTAKRSAVPLALAVILNQRRAPVSAARAASLLDGDAAAFVVAGDVDGLRRALRTGRAFHALAEAGVDGRPVLAVVANRPTLAWTTPVAALDGALRVSLEETFPVRFGDGELVFEAGRSGVVRIVNEGRAPRVCRIRTIGPDAPDVRERTLGAGETWVAELDGRP